MPVRALRRMIVITDEDNAVPDGEEGILEALRIRADLATSQTLNSTTMPSTVRIFSWRIFVAFNI
jgi:hypothetical protein